MSKTHLKKKKVFRGGCLCCPRTEDFLPLNTELYNGFGGYTIYRNNKLFFIADSDKKAPMLRKFEMLARKDKASWKCQLDLPLRSATWRRTGQNAWRLVETNRGFA
jgi:hypothetical protein